jgi:hypothetical protein
LTKRDLSPNVGVNTRGPGAPQGGGQGRGRDAAPRGDRKRGRNNPKRR